MLRVLAFFGMVLILAGCSATYPSRPADMKIASVMVVDYKDQAELDGPYWDYLDGIAFGHGMTERQKTEARLDKALGPSDIEPYFASDEARGHRAMKPSRPLFKIEMRTGTDLNKHYHEHVMEPHWKMFRCGSPGKWLDGGVVYWRGLALLSRQIKHATREEDRPFTYYAFINASKRDYDLVARPEDMCMQIEARNRVSYPFEHVSNVMKVTESVFIEAAENMPPTRAHDAAE